MASNRVPYDNWNIVSFYIRERLLRMGYEWEAHVLRERDSPNNGSLGSSHSPQQPPRRAGALQIRPGDPHTAIHGVLRDAGDEISRRYQRDFAEMSGQLHLTPSTARRKFAAVAEELFRDGVNWGRIVAFFEFGGTMCVESVNREMTSQVDHIADWMTDYLNGPLHNWIQDNGGWFPADRSQEIPPGAEAQKKTLPVPSPRATSLPSTLHKSCSPSCGDQFCLGLSSINYPVLTF
ncbi:apoptosis regulator Bcl-2 isoform X1 [Erpetoichthys calabaricus]|uniref:apoptosis regulator Bcl-2 isoform X1 n=1 Tax=Erpetoichthys calabaricus TaxID=27687 RepID=UPI002234B3D1|nr:apoptosis regulator Bcl-2 isoform X1 [Erpetoichthys calabaricus]